MPFSVCVLKEIFSDFKPDYTNEDMLALWTFTGGVARYVELLMTAGACTRKEMIRAIFGRLTAFIEEGKIVLMEEFGSDFATYFSILSSIAGGHTRFAEIANDLGVDVGTYLANLNEKYELISRVRPYLARLSTFETKTREVSRVFVSNVESRARGTVPCRFKS